MGKELKNKVTSFFSGSLVRNTLKLTGGSVINYIIPIITTPILTRLYAPDSYGDWGVFSSVISILSVFICAGYENAIVEEQDKERRNDIIKICLFNAALLNLVLLFVLGVLSFLGINVLNIQNIIFLLPLYLFLTGFVTVLQCYSNANGQYNHIAMAQIIAGLTLGAFRIVFGVFKIDNGLVYGAIISSICVVFYLIVKSRSLATKCQIVNKERIVSIIKQYKNYPLFDAPSNFIIFLSNNIPVLLLVNYFDKALLGGYTMVLQLLLLPMSFIGSNMGRVFFQQASSNKSTIDITANQVYKISFLLGLAVVVFFLIGGDYLLYLFLGPNWKMAGEYALYLSLWAFYTITYAPIKPIYRVMAKQATQMKLMLIAFFVQTGYLLLSVHLFNNMGIIIMTYSVVCSLFKVVEGKILLNYCNSDRLFYERKTIVISILVLTIWLLRSIMRLSAV